jgi:hypothetical protein
MSGFLGKNYLCRRFNIDLARGIQNNSGLLDILEYKEHKTKRK